MKFVVEAAGLTVAGGKELALDLMTRLAGHPRHQFTFIVPDLPAYRALGGGNVRTIVCRTGSGLVQRARLLNREVPRLCRRGRADALLCLGNFPPRHPVCPTAVLLQNAWMVYADRVAESRRTLRERLVTVYGRHAYRHLPRDLTIITQTAVMKDHLCRRYGVDAARVEIIPNALSLAKLGGSAAGGAPRASTPARPFTFLCLAHCYAHKNIDILLDAVQRLTRHSARPARCVITVAPDQHPRARRLLERLQYGELAGKIENIGPVRTAELPRVYQHADALIFPTLLESFSRTYLEALHFGLPILTSDRDFAHCLCRDAAVYFDPLDADAVARAMAGVMADADLRARLVASGRRILAEAPSWDEIAARFVEVLERTGSREWGESRRQKAEGSGGAGVGSGDWGLVSGELGRGGAARFDTPPAARKDGATFPTPDSPLPALDDVRALFNQKARWWRRKYGPKGKLNSRRERFAAHLARRCPPPARVLDLGCGTGEIAAALDALGYRVTACDVADEMIEVARRSHAAGAVRWVWLPPGCEALPFPASSFDAVVAASVFEYLADLPRVAAELGRVLRPAGVMLLTVPNPHHPVRRLEARLARVLAHPRLGPLAGKVPRLEAYAAYLRLSRNRRDEAGWQAVLRAAHFEAIDQSQFAPGAWRGQSHGPLVLLTVKREVEADPSEAAPCLACEEQGRGQKAVGRGATGEGSVLHRLLLKKRLL